MTKQQFNEAFDQESKRMRQMVDPDLLPEKKK